VSRYIHRSKCSLTEAYKVHSRVAAFFYTRARSCSPISRRTLCRGASRVWSIRNTYMCPFDMYGGIRICPDPHVGSMHRYALHARSTINSWWKQVSIDQRFNPTRSWNRKTARRFRFSAEAARCFQTHAAPTSWLHAQPPLIWSRRLVPRLAWRN
jgi:hypothetical protein